MDRLEQLNLKEIELKGKIEKFQNLPQKRWNLFKLVFICLFLIFGLTFSNSRRFGGVSVSNGNASVETKIEDSIVISIIVIPIIILGYLLSEAREMKKLEMDLEKVILEKNGFHNERS